MSRTNLLPILLFLFACGTRADKSEEQTTHLDSADHGYNELVNADSLSTFPISDYNEDNPDLANIERPEQSVIDSDLDTTLLFQIWAADLEGPHATFQWSGRHFYVVDYDGEGAMPFELLGRQLKVYYNDFIQEGEIVSLSVDTLRVKWKDASSSNEYYRWRER